MRVLHVVNGFALHGAPIYARDLAKGLVDSGHDSAVIGVFRTQYSENAQNDMMEDLRTSGVDAAVLTGRKSILSVFLAFLRLRSFVRRWKPDIVHAHADAPSLIMALTARFMRFPTARTIHNIVQSPGRSLAGRIREIAFRNELVVYISEATKEYYRETRSMYRLSESKHQLAIRTGIPFVKAKQYVSRKDLVERIGADPEKVLFCFAGRFVDQKGADVLIDSISMLPASYKARMQLHTFGAGNQVEKIKLRVAQKMLPVYFHTPISALPAVLAGFDAVFMPSRFEGLGLVAVEALSVGTPVIGTSAPGLIEAYPPDWPLVVPVEDSKALGNLIRRFIDGEFDLARLRRVGERWVKRRFRLEDMVGAYEKAYQDYLAAVG